MNGNRARGSFGSCDNEKLCFYWFLQQKKSRGKFFCFLFVPTFFAFCPRMDGYEMRGLFTNDVEYLRLEQEEEGKSSLKPYNVSYSFPKYQRGSREVLE